MTARFLRWCSCGLLILSAFAGASDDHRDHAMTEHTQAGHDSHAMADHDKHAKGLLYSHMETFRAQLRELYSAGEDDAGREKIERVNKQLLHNNLQLLIHWQEHAKGCRAYLDSDTADAAQQRACIAQLHEDQAILLELMAGILYYQQGKPHSHH